MINRLCKIIFLGLTALIVTNQKVEASSHVIFLKGSCSSGKTTLLSTLIQDLPELQIIDEDSLVYERYTEAVKKRFPDKYFLIEKALGYKNIYPALRYNKISFKETVSFEERVLVEQILFDLQNELNDLSNLPWKKGVSESISVEIIHKIGSFLKEDKISIVDAWYVTPEEIERKYSEVSTHSVLLYCPFEIVYERFQKRNKDAYQSGCMEEFRYIRQLLSFFSLFQIRSSSENSIEPVDIDKLNQIFDAIENSLDKEETTDPKPNFTFEEVSKSQFREFREKIMAETKNRNSESFYISPTKKYDLILDARLGVSHDAVTQLFKTPK